MPSTYTNNLRLEKQADGEDNLTWGQKVNTQFDLLDSAVAGVASVDVTGQTLVTLTVGTGVADQARAAVLVVSGALTGNCRIVYPAVTKTVMVYNITTGGWGLTIAQGASNPGFFYIPPNCGTMLYFDGTNPNPIGGAQLAVNGINASGTGVFGLLQSNSSISLGSSTSTLTLSNYYGYSQQGPGASPGQATVNYSLYAANICVGLAFFATSDARTKDDIESMTPEQGRAWVQAARPVVYSRDGRYNAGFLAQDQARHGYDHLVALMPADGAEQRTDDDGFVSPAGALMHMDYLQTIAYLTAHAQSLEARLAKLELARAD